MTDQARTDRLSGGDLFAASHAPISVSHHLVRGHLRAHDHDFLEVVLIVSGRGAHHSILGKQPITAGDVLVLRPGVWHAYDDCHDLEVYNCGVGMELFQRELAWIRQDPLLGLLYWTGPSLPSRRGILAGRLDGPDVLTGRDHFAALHRASREAPPYGRADRIGHLLLILGLLARGLRAGDGGERRAPPHRAVQDGVLLLEQTPAHPWSAGELADRLHIDRHYLARLFKSGTGVSPMAYLSRCRVERAAALLLRTDLPIGRVGAAVGYPDPAHFARRFKGHFGLSAGAYRATFTDPRRPAASTPDPSA